MSDKKLKPYQSRVVIEYNELTKKIKDLYDFSESDFYQTLPEDQEKLLREQYDIMNKYQSVLFERMKLFNIEIYGTDDPGPCTCKK